MDMFGDLCAIGLPLLLLVGAIFAYGARQGAQQRVANGDWQDVQAQLDHIERQNRHNMSQLTEMSNTSLATFQQSVRDFQLQVHHRLMDSTQSLNLTAYQPLTPPPIPELPDPIPLDWQSAILDMSGVLRELRGEPNPQITFKSYGQGSKMPLYTMGRANPRTLGRQAKTWVRPDLTNLECGVCGTTIENNEGLGCSGCHTPHHHACWDYNGQCAIFGCQCDIPEDLGQGHHGHDGVLPKPTLGECYLA